MGADKSENVFPDRNDSFSCIPTAFKNVEQNDLTAKQTTNIQFTWLWAVKTNFSKWKKRLSGFDQQLLVF